MDEITRMGEIPFEQQETLPFTISLESDPSFQISWFQTAIWRGKNATETPLQIVRITNETCFDNKLTN